METVERKKPRPRRSFTPEFKAEIVELCRKAIAASAK
jgi:transposase